jgi:hypothetical protein
VPGFNCLESYSEKMYVIFLIVPHACSQDVAEPSVSEFRVSWNMMLRLSYFAGPGLGWVTLLAYELLIFVLTVYRICKTRGLSLAMSRRNILDIIFQDGNFCCIGIVSIDSNKRRRNVFRVSSLEKR